MVTRRILTIAIFALAACGGHKQQPAAPSGGDDTGGGETGGETSANPCGDDGMCPPETLDRIKEVLDSKRTTMSRCLTDAQNAGQAEKTAKGKITVTFVIAPSGKAKNVKIGESSINSKAVTDCVIAKVEQISFPEVPKDLDWSYTYGLESN